MLIFVHLFVCSFVCPSVHPSVRPSIRLVQVCLVNGKLELSFNLALRLKGLDSFIAKEYIYIPPMY